MRPVLLPRQEVEKRKAEEQRQRIEEGMKIASRVDTLREVKASEEVAFEVWRTETLKGIQAEIDARFLVKEQLEVEVANLEKRRREALKPIDEEWERVEEAKLDIQSEENRLQEVESNLSKAISLNIQRERDNESLKKELELEQLKQQRLRADAEQEKKQAHATLVAAQKEAKSLISKAEMKDKQSKIRSKQLDEFQERLRLGQVNLTNQKKDLQEREFKVRAKELQFNSPIKKI